jgi:hypothetical protein
MATKTCDKTQELPLEECYFPTIGVYTFSIITVSLCPQNGVWLTVYLGGGEKFDHLVDQGYVR